MLFRFFFLFTFLYPRNDNNSSEYNFLNNNTNFTYPRGFQNNSLFVVARFDLNKVWLELMISVCVPGTLFIVSFVTLLIITQTVKVGDDARMRCKWWWCTDDNSDTEQLKQPEYDDRKVTFADDNQQRQDLLAMENLIAIDQDDNVNDKNKPST